MAESRADLQTLVRMRHSEVRRQGKPRLENVKADSLEIVAAIAPPPSFVWRGLLEQATQGTVLEGRVTLQANEIKLQTSDEELEQDVRRLDQLLSDANTAYNRKLDEAKAFLEKPEQADAKTEEQRRRELEARLRKL